MKTLKACSLALLMLPVCAAAQVPLTPEFGACLDKAGGVTSSMVECILTETKVQDARLNVNYKKLLSTSAPGRKNALLEAQRAWIRYRDLNCKFYDDPDGGSMARIDSNDCVMRTTAERAKELGDFMR